MAKGVKKIKLAKGPYYPDKSQSKTTQVTIAADKEVTFEVEEWIKGTPEEVKSQKIYWMRQTKDRKTILFKGLGKNLLFHINKKFSGPYTYYIEASLSGKRDYKNAAGIYVNAYTEPLIKASDWRRTPKGADIKNGTPIKYGELVYIWLDTEGLNGSQVTIEVYNQALGADNYVDRFTNVLIRDGEVAYRMANTSKWRSKVGFWKEGVEEFYVKVKYGNTYLKDHLGDKNHAIYLGIENKVVKQEVGESDNITPTKVFEPKVNAKRHEPCKFDEITLTLPIIKDGKTETNTIPIFKDGQALKGKQTTIERINRTIHFKFNDYSIAPDAQKILNNILGFLLLHEGTTIHLNGYACVIGKEEYNQKLSQQRGDAVKDFFDKGGLDGRRIKSEGKGEYNIQSPDDYSHRNEKVYKDARRVDISFTFAGHNAVALTLETIAPSSDKLVTLDVIGLDTKDCYRDKNKHKKEVIIMSPDAKEYKNSGDSIEFPIRSTLSKLNPAPINYIWPTKNALHKFGDSAAVYQAHIHSCRYYSDKNKTTINIKAYPDIKWNFQVSFNYEHAAAYTHGNLPEYKRDNSMTGEVKAIKREIREAQSKAVGSGKETKKMANSPKMLSKFELKLDAKWNNEKQSTELSFEFAKKTRNVINAMLKYKEIAEKVKNTLGGKAKNSIMRPPFMLEVQSPSLNGNIEWYLEQGKDKYKTQVATIGMVKLKAEPLIGASFIIDLLAVGSRMHPLVAAMIAGIDFALSKLKGGMTFEIQFYGKLEFDIKAIEFSTLTGVKHGNINLGAKLGIILKLEISFKVKYKKLFVSVHAELHAVGKAEAYFAGKLKIDSDNKGLYLQPELSFSGLIFTFEAEIIVGGFKRILKFGNEDAPFLRSENASKDLEPRDSAPKIYIID